MRPSHNMPGLSTLGGISPSFRTPSAALRASRIFIWFSARLTAFHSDVLKHGFIFVWFWVRPSYTDAWLIDIPWVSISSFGQWNWAPPPCFPSLSTVSFPSLLMWPFTHNIITLFNEAHLLSNEHQFSTLQLKFLKIYFSPRLTLKKLYPYTLNIPSLNDRDIMYEHLIPYSKDKC